MEKKISAPIDNKNVLEDFIYHDIFNDNYLETPANKGSNRDIIGYYEGKLLGARWSFGGSRLCFTFISAYGNNVDYMVELPKFKESFEDMINNNNDDLQVETFISGDWLICDFYWKEQ